MTRGSARAVPPEAPDWLVRARERVRVFAQYEGTFQESADVVVVGSGPCGAVAAYELALAGHDVVLLEEGPPFTVRDFELDGNLSMTRTMREGGLRMTWGTRMPTMQAVALGGGSLVNSGICVRPPDSVFERWATEFELERTDRAHLDPHFHALGEFLGIAPTPDEVQGRRNLLFRDACDALGIESEPIARNVRGCRGSGECFTGCRSRAKQSMDVSYVP
ncbi:MAG: GMC family oxidoreductase N-terminal domain-containing protein, partial [Deltaproteobacteria bacterium]|nr:GMC family oxidoreductase N-terminal domain-containing protein [Deltaproteobacteria bacterium]